MNYIDKKYQELLEEILLFSETEIYEHIKEKLKLVPVETQQNISAFLEQFSFWGSFHPLENDYDTIEKVSHFLKENAVKFQELYAKFQDYRSKKTLYAILNNWYNYDFKNLEEVMEHCYEHYFDLDIIPNCQEEVFVDLGAFTGDTIQSFIKNYGPDSYQKIYAYEMTEQSMEELKKNLTNNPRIIYCQKAVFNEIGKGMIAYHETNASSNQVAKEEVGDLRITTLDEDIKEKITILKMDIEGSEFFALQGSEKHLIEDHPILILSVYHGYQDLIRLYEYLESLELKYTYYLRYYGGPIFPTEIVLYAIPV